MLVVVALVLALVIKSFAIQAFFIPSSSMENTLEINDRVLINKIVYHLRPIHRGDIIVFDGTGSWDPSNPSRSTNIFSKAVDELEGIVGISHDSSIYIKRVIGLPGDHVKCCNHFGQMTVNGTPLHEGDYLYPLNQPSAQTFDITVPAGRLWVMGDHRAVSYDSRGHSGDAGRRDDTGKRRARPRVRHHLAAEPVGLPQHSGDIRGTEAERAGGAGRQRRGGRLERRA